MNPSNAGHSMFQSAFLHHAPERGEFEPPPAPGLGRGLVLALLAHGLLLAALTLGVQWKRQAENLSVEAELWSTVPQQAAPKAVEAPPPPLPPPVVQRAPEPPRPAVDISVEKEKARLAAEKARMERERAEEKEREKERQKRALEKQAAERQAAEDKKKRELEAARRAEAEKVAAAKQREANLQRMAGLAGATGAPSATGNALQSSGPSQGYAGRIRARVKPNIVFTEDISGNPTAEVQVRVAPDGTIVGRELIKSSGVKSWDEAVLKAIDKTEVLPRDVDGRVPSAMVISFRPKD